jgi:hypothetical protein
LYDKVGRPYGGLSAVAVLTLTAILACYARGVGSNSSEADRCSARWTSSVLWPSMPHPLEALSVAGWGPNLLIAGNVQNATDPALLGQLELVDLQGRSIEVPPSAREGIRPRIALTGDTVYLLWGEAKPDTVRMNNGAHYPRRARAVWLSSRVRGVWSAPRELIRVNTGEVAWEPEHVSALVRDFLGAIHFAFIAGETPSNARLVEVTLKGARADASEVPVPTFAAYIQLAIVGKRIVVLYVHGDMSRAPDQNSVAVTSRAINDTSWTAARTVQIGGNQGALYARLVATPDGVLHAIWSQSVADGLRPEILRHVASRDQGQTWSAPADMSAPGALAVIAFAASRTDVAVLYYEYDGGGRRTVMACWRSQAGWQRARPVSNRSISEPELTEDRRAIVAVGGQEGTRPVHRNVLLQLP